MFGSSIVLTADATISAYAVKDGCVSDVVTYQYAITPDMPLMLVNMPVNQNGELITAENVEDLTAVSLVVENLSDSVQNSLIAVAFYEEDGRFISVDIQEAAIRAESNETVVVPVSHDLSNAAKMKVFLLNTNCCPMSEASEFTL